MGNVPEVKNRTEFRAWLMENGGSAKECWLVVRRGRPTDERIFWYIDAVEEALCFGWIDSTTRKENGLTYQRFSPRKKGGQWTELNKERVRRLERLGLMTDAGRAVLPDMDRKSFKVDPDIEAAMKKARVWTKFMTFPPLYRRVKSYSVAFYKGRFPEEYERALNHLIEETKKGKTYGNWNDYGRLI